MTKFERSVQILCDAGVEFVIIGGVAANLAYWGLPSNTSFTFKGNASFTGIVYAPEADFTLGGGGLNDYDFVGACVVNTIKMNGHFHFHYDEALRRKYWNGYQAAGWNEVDPSATLSQF